MFWLSYECFSIFHNAFLLKSAIFSHNSCAQFNRQYQGEWNTPTKTDCIISRFVQGTHGCSNHLNLEMGAACLTKTLSYILEFKYPQNKKWQKQAVKNARIKKSFSFSLFSFHSIKTHNFPPKIGDFQHLPRFHTIREAPYGCRFLYFFSLCHVSNKAVFLLLEHSSPRGLTEKT